MFARLLIARDTARMHGARTNDGRRWWEPGLVTLFAVLVMVGAWSAAQRHELVPAGAVAGLGNAPRAGTVFVPISELEGEFYRVDYRKVSPQVNSNSSTGGVSAAVEDFATVRRRPRGGAAGSSPFTSATAAARASLTGKLNFCEYSWPTKAAGWNLLVGLVLVVGTGFAVEGMARRRGRVALVEMLLAVTVAAVMLAVGRSYWSGSEIAGKHVVVQGVVAAGVFCTLLVAVWCGWKAVAWTVGLRARQVT